MRQAKTLAPAALAIQAALSGPRALAAESEAVTGLQAHPLEPRSAKLTVTATF